MLDMQERLIEKLKAQIKDSTLQPDELERWSADPVTVHFLNILRLEALELDSFEYLDYSPEVLVKQVSLNAGHCRAIENMETLAVEFSGVTEVFNDE